MPTVEYSESEFIGVDTFHDPSKLAPGMLAQADNLLVDGKSLVVRPGKRGLLAAPLGSALYEPCPYVRADGTTEIVFSSGGRLYRLAKTASAASEILKGGASFSLNSPGVFLERAGKFLYGVDGSGPLFRTDLATGASVAGLAAPAVAPGVALTGRVLDAFNDASSWQADSLTAAQTNQVVNGDFSGGGTAGPGSPAADYVSQAGWTGVGVSVDYYNNPSGHAGVWENCDTPGDSIVSTAFIGNFAQALDSARKATEFFLSFKAFSLDTQNRGSLIATIIAYDAAGNEIARLSKETPVLSTGGQVNTYPAVYSFGDLGVPIAKYKIQFTNGVQNQLGTSNSVYLSGIVSYPTVPPVSLSAQSSSSAGSGGLVVSVGQAAGGPQMFLNGAHLRHTFPAAQDLSQTETLAIGLGAGAALLSGLRFHLRLRKSGGTAWYDTNPVTLDLAAGLATVDITAGGIPADVRASCGALEIVFDGDVTYTGPGQIVLGPLTAAGNLTVGRADYLYRATEIDASADPAALLNILQSNPSPLSAAITPTATQAQAALSLPAAVNAASTHLGVYREGGGLADGLARLVAIVSLSADTVSFGDGALVTWNHTTRAFVDNTPDSFLIGATLAPTGHDAPPAGAQCIAFWQGRLCLAVGSRLYISNLVDDDVNAGLYFPTVNDPEDPTAAVQGANFAVGGKDNDPIQRLIAFGSHLIILKGRSIWVATGVDAADFQVQSYLLKAGVGCVAPRAAGIVGNRIWFRGASGLYQFDADVVDPVSVAVEKTLALGGAAAGCALAYHGRRMYLFAPDAGGSVNGVAFVYDERQNGYTRYLQMNVSGAASLSGGQDTDDFYLAGLDGQVYRLGGAGDQAAPGAAVLPVAWAAATRGFHDGDFRYAQAACGVYFGAVSQEAAALTVGVKDADGAASAGQAFTIGAAGATTHATPRLRARGGLRARALQAMLSGSCAQPFRLLSLGLTATTGRRL